MNPEKGEWSFLWNLKSKIQEHYQNKSLKTLYFKDFSRTTYNSRTIQAIQGIQEPLATLFSLSFHTFQIQKDKQKWNNLWYHELACIDLILGISQKLCCITSSPANEWRENAIARAHTRYYLFRCAIVAHAILHMRNQLHYNTSTSVFSHPL